MDMSKSQRHTRSGAGRGVSQANGAAFHTKLPGLCQHEIVRGILKKLSRPIVGRDESCDGAVNLVDS